MKVRGMQCFTWRNLRERDHLEELGVDGRMILKWTSKKYKGGVNGIYMAEHVEDCRDCFYALINNGLT